MCSTDQDTTTHCVRGKGILASVSDVNLPAAEFAEGCKLLQAVARNDIEGVKIILSADPTRVNFRDYDRRTAVHVASSEGHLNLVRYLVDQCGAKVNRSDRWGGSPLDDARRHHHTGVADFLRGRGATTGCADRTLNLISAAAAGDVDEVKMILSGAILVTPQAAKNLDMSSSSSISRFQAVDVNAGDYDNRTALHLAAGEGHVQVIELLCAKGANTNVEDRWGGRPLDDAKRRNFEACVQVLEKYGAKSVKGESMNGLRRSYSSSSLLHLADEKNDNLDVDFNELEMIEKIGSGAFGEIYKCRWRGILVAAKCVKATKIQREWMAHNSKDESISRRMTYQQRMQRFQDEMASMDEEGKNTALADFRQETAILSSLRHPNICMLLAYSHTENFEVMISELMKCSLLDVFKANLLNNTQLSKKKQIIYAQQLAQGMHYLHTCRPPIIHRDLKPANLLIDFSGTLKITDFGLAKIQPEPEQRDAEQDQFLMTGETGSYRFMAPEVFRCEEYTETVDIYSYAMIFYNLLSGRPPWPTFNGMKAASKAAIDGQRPLTPREWDERLVVLMTRCWNGNPQLRPSFKVIVTELSDYLRDVFNTDRDTVPMHEQENKCYCVIS